MKRKRLTRKKQSRRRVRKVTKKKTPRKYKGREYYILNPDFDFFDEMRSLVLKSSPEEKNGLVRKISRLGRIKLAVISGIFLNTAEDSALDTEPVADLFIVGDDISRRRLTFFLQALEAEVGKEIKFGIMDRDEFDYRYRMFDRFVRVLLEGPHEKIINKLGI